MSESETINNIEENIDEINQEESFQDETTEKEGRYKEGDELQMVRVRFPGNSKSFPFLLGKRTFAYGQKVVAMSDRGMDVGYINSFPYKVKFDKSMLPIRTISKTATQEDLDEQKNYAARSKEAWHTGVELVQKHNLDMNITHVEIIQFGKKMVFYFTAPQRVDFRELVKDLVGKLKMRIELRQISVRDRAAALGSIGPCGQMTCCSSFLKNYGSVSIKMAKNQNLALIPSKINGVCGQIKCCIKFEEDVYTEKRKKLPREGSIIKAKNGDIGKITRLHILAERFDMLTDRGIFKRYASSQFDESINLPADYQFPQEFESITTELDKVIGLEDELDMRKNQMLQDDDQTDDISDEMEPDDMDYDHQDDENDEDYDVQEDDLYGEQSSKETSQETNGNYSVSQEDDEEEESDEEIARHQQLAHARDNAPRDEFGNIIENQNRSPRKNNENRNNHSHKNRNRNRNYPSRNFQKNQNGQSERPSGQTNGEKSNNQQRRNNHKRRRFNKNRKPQGE
ncbi:MAG: hypothetical protein Fur0010_22130 [Bdellovibrio sp.]